MTTCLEFMGVRGCDIELEGDAGILRCEACCSLISGNHWNSLLVLWSLLLLCGEADAKKQGKGANCAEGHNDFQ